MSTGMTHNVDGFIKWGYLKYVRPAAELVLEINLFIIQNIN
jgi:hypothetical protein